MPARAFQAPRCCCPSLPCSHYPPWADINGGMAADCKDDLRIRDRGWRGLFQPDLVVVEGRAADRRDRGGAGQRVDAATADMVLVRVDRFRDQHAAAQAIE